MTKLAKKVSKARKIQRDRALEISASFVGDEADAYMSTTDRLAKKMHKGYFPMEKEVNICKEPHMTKR